MNDVPHDGSEGAPAGARSPGRRLAAIGALVLAGTTAVVAAVGVSGQLWRVLLVPVLLLVVTGAGWVAATRTGVARLGATGIAAVGAAAIAALALTGETSGLLLVVFVVLVAASIALCRYALAGMHAEVAFETRAGGTSVRRALRGALIMNPKSGGGKAVRFHLEDEANKRGIEPIVLSPGDDLVQLARDAIDRGVDVIGVAGGDGTQALVASIAMTADVAVVCVPAGTRNHFALDLGLDRDDVVGALDAFGEAIEHRIDLATVGDRVFVNNVSLGVYAKIVQSPEYRDAKRQTTAKMLPELLGPDAAPFDLRFTSPDGVAHGGAQIVLVSNNPYTFSALGGFGTRARIDGGELGVSTAEVHGGGEAAEAAAAIMAGRPDRFRGWSEWAAPEFVVDSGRQIEAGVDGEALLLDPPLVFRSLPGALRVRIPTHAPGLAPAALRSPSVWWSISALFRVIAGRPAPA